MYKLTVTVLIILILGYIVYKLIRMLKRGVQRDVIFLSIATMSLSFMLGLLLYSFVPLKTPTSVYITAAHIPREEVEAKGFKLIYEDTDKDTAYYLDTEWKPKASLLDRNVKINGLYGKVTKEDSDYFYVGANSPEFITKGLSGCRVYSGSEVLGFVSSLSDGLLKCVYI